MEYRKIVVEELIKQLQNPEKILDLNDVDFLQIATDVRLAIIGLENVPLSEEQQKVMQFLQQCDSVFEEEMQERGYAFVDTKDLLEQSPEQIVEKLFAAPMKELLTLRDFAVSHVAEEPGYAKIIPLIDDAIVSQTAAANILPS